MEEEEPHAALVRHMEFLPRRYCRVAWAHRSVRAIRQRVGCVNGVVVKQHLGHSAAPARCVEVVA
jgi:hypothetical protein